jgi:hypothetical protein
MSHGVHAVQHEVEHELEHGGKHGGHAPKSENVTNKRIALVIAVLALILAFAETLGKSAQTAAISSNVEAANLWAFFQAKTIRRTTVETAAQALALESQATANDEIKAAMAKQIDTWQKNAARYRSEPETGEGSQELAERAKQAEHKRGHSMAQYHHFEVASAALQIGIVLASAAVITGMIALAWISGALGIVGLAFIAIGLFAPEAVHLF